MERRALLQWLVATGGLAAVHRLSARDLDTLGDDAHRRMRDGTSASAALSAAEQLTVAAAAECIIPRTDSPGATDANVAQFVDVMLADWYPASDAERFRAGLAQLDTASQGRFGVPFASATSTQQAELVESLDTEVSAMRRSDAPAANQHWFGMLKYLTVWGYCTSEVAMRQLFHSLPRPLKYDGAAPVRS